MRVLLAEDDRRLADHVDPVLQQVRQFEERPRNAGHHEPDSRGSDEEASILPAAQQGARVDLIGVAPAADSSPVVMCPPLSPLSPGGPKASPASSVSPAPQPRPAGPGAATVLNPLSAEPASTASRRSRDLRRFRRCGVRVGCWRGQDDVTTCRVRSARSSGASRSARSSVWPASAAIRMSRASAGRTPREPRAVPARCHLPAPPAGYVLACGRTRAVARRHPIASTTNAQA